MGRAVPTQVFLDSDDYYEAEWVSAYHPVPTTSIAVGYFDYLH